MQKYTVVVSDKLSEEGLGVLRSSAQLDVKFMPGLSPTELSETLIDADALVIRSNTQVTSQILKDAKKLKMVGRAGIGVDNVDMPAAKARGVVVMNTPTGNTITTAEHAISLMLSLARQIPQASADMRSGAWTKSKYQGTEITGKTLGIIGLGNIGKEVAKRAYGLQMNVVAFDPVVTSNEALKCHAHKVDLDELFEMSDFITIHAPLNIHTKHLINTDSIAKMKDGVRIIQASRGGIVDESALLAGLTAGKIAGAALDVFETEPPPKDFPLLAHPNVIATPHLGASTSEAQTRVGVQVARQTLDFLLKGKVVNAV